MSVKSCIKRLRGFLTTPAETQKLNIHIVQIYKSVQCETKGLNPGEFTSNHRAEEGNHAKDRANECDKRV